MAARRRRLGLLRRSVTFQPRRARDVLAQVPAGDVLLSAGSFDDDVAIAQWGSERRWRAVGLVAAGPYPAAAAFAAGVVWQRGVKEAGTVESLPVLSASQRLDTTTLFGRFRVDRVTGVQTGHQIRVVQWRGGQRVLVDRPLGRT